MKITSTQIAAWAKTKEAQGYLPKLLRGLVHASVNPTEIAFPAGDSTCLPSWDGELACEQGSPWVPSGKSYWELSCEARSTVKANKDYVKRTNETSEEIRLSAALIVVSARRWNGKRRWIETKRSAGEWADVRAYDADDIEQWLEQSPAVALQYGEELGLTGPGVVSTGYYWQVWSQQSTPTISAAAMFTDREIVRERLIGNLRHLIAGGQAEVLSVKADSVDEAAAFVCAAIIAHEDISSTSFVVTESTGWRFAEQNPTIRVSVAAKPEIAEKPSCRKQLVVIIPYSAADMTGHYKGVAGQDHTDFIVERPKIYEFEKALTSIGLDEAEAKRLALSTGRSWSVFRRRCAVNPSIRRPIWLDEPQSAALSVLCLLGAWSTESVADREIVARLSGRTYEKVERDLQHLSVLEDSPVLHIGNVWKAKSPLELLDLFGDRITRDELERFFAISREILLAPDPLMELPDDKRYAAQIYGKVRPQSGLLINSLCDTLIKLAVRGPQVPALLSVDIEGQVNFFVHELLHDADGTRWLSLSSLLPSLAESAPDAFLKAVEVSLVKPDAPVTKLLAETNSSSLMGQCWHAGLLWALEILAWAPERVTRVALLLARLSHFEIKGNWGNTPKASLLDIFRSWIPQTAADLKQRIAALDTLIAREPDAAFDLLDSLVHVAQDFAMPSSRPRWRDEDTGAGRGVTEGDLTGMLIAAADRLISCSQDNAYRIACLIEKISIFDPARKKATLALAEKFSEAAASDEEREIIRTALRKKIAWHRNYDKVHGRALDNKLRAIETLYERLLPGDIIVRHRWLFSDNWPDLPLRIRDEDFNRRAEMLESLRNNALREIYSDRGIAGIEQLAASCGNQLYVGVGLSKLGLAIADMAEWIVKMGNDFATGETLTTTICGVLRALPNPQSTELIKAVLERGKERGWDVPQTTRFLVLAREERATWDILISCGTEVENAYWSNTRLSWFLSREPDFEFALRQLLKADRPRAALQVCHSDLKNVPADLLVEMLERILMGEEMAGPLPESWIISKALDLIEKSGAIDRDRLIRLEFGLIPALGYQGEQCAGTLYKAITSDPRLFNELLCILYKPAHGEREEPASETMQAAVRNAWRVLHNCRRLPGIQTDGTIDQAAFVRFIDEARELAREADRLLVCDLTIGRILAYAPADADGTWPALPVRDVLDRLEFEDMRRGFQNGVFSKRGVTTRSPDEGGDQERKLADSFRVKARTLQSSHINVAAALEEIARSYDNYGQREDIEAMLRRESY